MRSLFRRQIMSVKGRRSHLNSRGDSENLAPNITKFERQRHVLHDSFMASSLPLPVSLSFRASRSSCRIYGDGIAGWLRPSEGRGMRCGGQRGNRTILSPLIQFMADHSTLDSLSLFLSLSLSSSAASLFSLFPSRVLSVSLYVYVRMHGCTYAHTYTLVGTSV